MERHQRISATSGCATTWPAYPATTRPVFGNALHQVVEDAAAAEPRIGQYLREHSVTVSRIEKIRPTLEDVFVSLTTTRGAAEEKKP